MQSPDFYASLSEKEARTLLAPLAAAVMLASDKGRDELRIVDGQAFEPWNIVRQYESYIDIFYSSFKTIHDIS